MTRPRDGSKLAGLGLAPRLLLNNLLVIVAGAGTVLVTALLIAPAVFESHLRSVEPIADSQLLEHVARAFDESILVALGVGILIAGITGSAISWLAARRLAAPVADAADAAGSLADGHLEARVVDPRMGPEFAKLATSVNALADRLQATEADPAAAHRRPRPPTPHAHRLDPGHRRSCARRRPAPRRGDARNPWIPERPAQPSGRRPGSRVQGRGTPTPPRPRTGRSRRTGRGGDGGQPRKLSRRRRPPEQHPWRTPHPSVRRP